MEINLVITFQLPIPTTYQIHLRRTKERSEVRVLVAVTCVKNTHNLIDWWRNNKISFSFKSAS